LYKVFSKVLCGRIKEQLIAQQSHDQAGFRPGFSCDDHLFAITLLAEKCNEFNLPLWTATLDFSKAFDSINHASIWSSLRQQNVPEVYVDVLSRSYHAQYATVKGECPIRKFCITKGTKQGDPISPYIFNSVLEQVMRTVKAKWSSKKYGIDVGSGAQHLTNLRFADDILLVGRTLPQIKQMIADVSVEGAKIGLQLHPEKSKIMNTGIGCGSGVRNAKVEGMSIEVLEAGASAMYLGRSLTWKDTHYTELAHRLKKGWAKFGTYRQELTDRAIPLHLRMKLFHSVVTPTILYGCCSWVMNTSREAALRTTQMKMLRVLLGRKRKVDNDTGEIESWVEWVQQATFEVRETMRKYEIPDWILEQRQRVRLWNQRVTETTDHRWTNILLHWCPSGRRSRGHPLKRWQDQLQTLTS
jgi:hypothetical protein